MVEPKFWRRVFRVGFYSVIVYATTMFILTLGMFISGEGALEQLFPSPATGNGPIPVGTVKAQIRNAFGDIVPGAVVHLGERKVTAGANGEFVLEDVPVGRHELQVEAPGYHFLVLSVRVEPGVNRPRIKHDTGLWPDSFALDFHVFYNRNRNSVSTLYGLVGVANGREQNLYIRSIVVIDPLGNILQDFLATENDYRRVVQGTARTELTEEPQMAIVLPPRTLFELELRPVPSPLDGLYELQVLVGDKQAHESGTYEVIRLQDRMDEDTDWNPHAP